MLASLCIFCTFAALQLHEFIGAPGGLPGVSTLVAQYLMSSSIALWVRIDAQERGRDLAYDLDSFMFILWPLAAPFISFALAGGAPLARSQFLSG